jgi:hypothetical protein
MIKEVTAKNSKAEYKNMKDFFGVTSDEDDDSVEKPTRKPRVGLFHRKEFYKALTFTKESRTQLVDLGEVSTAERICAISLTSPGIVRRDYRDFSYKLGETSLGQGSSLRGVPDKLETIFSAKLAEGEPIDNFQISYCLSGLWPPETPEIQAFIKIAYN